MRFEVENCEAEMHNGRMVPWNARHGLGDARPFPTPGPETTKGNVSRFQLLAAGDGSALRNSDRLPHNSAWSASTPISVSFVIFDT